MSAANKLDSCIKKHKQGARHGWWTKKQPIAAVCFIHITIVMMVLTASPLLADESKPSRCMMQPHYLEMRLPNRGFVWLPGEDSSGKCENVPQGKWIKKSAGSLDLFVYARGPSGSGRYWEITIGVGEKGQSKPQRGICLATSTVGWRTYQYYNRTPLSWLDDLDNDGRAEVIIWDSFPLQKDVSMAEYGLVAWVYRLTPKDTLIIDWKLSRRMAREVAQVYGLARDSSAAYPGHLANEAADALKQFADERCLILDNSEAK
jgi:hypothetical protein